MATEQEIRLAALVRDSHRCTKCGHLLHVPKSFAAFECACGAQYETEDASERFNGRASADVLRVHKHKHTKQYVITMPMI